MLSGRWTLVLRDGKWYVRGIDQPDADEHARIDLAGGGKAIVLKRRGHSAWAGILAPREYIPVEFEVWRIVEDSGGNLYCEAVCSFPASKPKG